MENVPALCIGMADGCSSCAGEGRAAQPELVASAQELMRMLQVIEGEILPRTAKGVAAGHKVSPTLHTCSALPADPAAGLAPPVALLFTCDAAGRPAARVR